MHPKNSKTFGACARCCHAGGTFELCLYCGNTQQDVHEIKKSIFSRVTEKWPTQPRLITGG